MPTGIAKRISRRLDKVERAVAHDVWKGPWPSLDDAIARRLSESDRAQVPEAIERRCDPDCPQGLQAVFRRWGVAFQEAQAECGWPIVFDVNEWFY